MSDLSDEIDEPRPLAAPSRPIREYSCDISERQFSTRSARSNHQRVHDIENLPQIRRKRKKKYLCDRCGARTTSKQSLQEHHRIAHEASYYKCSTCGKELRSRQGFKAHILTHGERDEYECRYCDLVFGDGSTRAKHERTHTGERPFVCNICGEDFNQRVLLTSHMRCHPK